MALSESLHCVGLPNGNCGRILADPPDLREFAIWWHCRQYGAVPVSRAMSSVLGRGFRAEATPVKEGATCELASAG